MKREEMARGTGGTGAEGVSRPTGKRGSILRGPITAAAGSLAALLRGNGNASGAMAKDPVSSWGKLGVRRGGASGTPPPTGVCGVYSSATTFITMSTLNSPPRMSSVQSGSLPSIQMTTVILDISPGLKPATRP